MFLLCRHPALEGKAVDFLPSPRLRVHFGYEKLLSLSSDSVVFLRQIRMRDPELGSAIDTALCGINRSRNCDRADEDGDHNSASIILLILLLTFYFPTHPPGDIGTGWTTNSVILLLALTAIVSSAAVFAYLKPLGGNSNNICPEIVDSRDRDQEEGGDPLGYAMKTSIKCSEKAPVTWTPKLDYDPGGNCILYVTGRPNKQ